MLLRTLAFDATKHSAKALLSDGERCDKPKVRDAGSDPERCPSRNKREVFHWDRKKYAFIVSEKTIHK